MKSEIVEKTSDTLHTAFGKWRLLGVDDLVAPYLYDPRDNYVYESSEYRHRYVNEAIPIVMEIKEDSYGELSTERIRSLFAWEDGFEKFDRLKGISNWIEQVMFKTTLPKDYKYTIKQRHLYAPDIYTSIGEHGPSPVRLVTKYSFLPVNLGNLFRKMRRDTNFQALAAAAHAGFDLPPMHTIAPNQYVLANDEIYYIDDIFKDLGYNFVRPEDFEPRHAMNMRYHGQN